MSFYRKIFKFKKKKDNEASVVGYRGKVRRFPPSCIYCFL